MSSPELLCQSAYLPYPHANPFTKDGRVLMVQQDQDGRRIVAKGLAAHDGDVKTIVQVNPVHDSDKHLIFDIAYQASRLMLNYNQAVYLIDPGQYDARLPSPIYRPDAGAVLYGIPSIRSDGTTALILEHQGDVSTLNEINVDTGKVRVLMKKSWLVGHAHYVPGDENWVGVCHEGPTEKIPDRVWAWHERLAPEGRCVFDQKSDDPKYFLNVGHERWGFLGASGLAVAYGCSPAGPRGLWQVFADGRAAKQIFSNDRCWHCDISRDGRYALADTTGTWNLPGHGWENDDKNRSILLIDVATGRHVVLGSAGGDTHPYHPHPIFSPDGQNVFFNTKRGNETAVMIVRIGDPAAYFA